MKTGDYFGVNSLPQKFANSKGKMSTQFMSMDLEKKNLSIKRALEASVNMGSYELNIRKPVKNRIDVQQPMSYHSEFWIG